MIITWKLLYYFSEQIKLKEDMLFKGGGRMILMGNGCFATSQNCGMLRLEASSPTQC